MNYDLRFSKRFDVFMSLHIMQMHQDICLHRLQDNSDRYPDYNTFKSSFNGDGFLSMCAKKIEENRPNESTLDGGPYFDWDVTSEQGLTETKGTNSITARACRAAMHLQMQLSKETEKLLS